MPGQIGDHDPVRGRELGDHPHPVRGVARGPVEQDDRRAVAALQHGGGDAGQLDPPLGEGKAGEQLLAVVLDARGRHAGDATDAYARRHRLE